MSVAPTGSQMTGLRAKAEGLGQALPPLLAAAERLAATLVLGEHGRRQAGMGDAFWQYRPATPSDAARRIDWRRSGRGDVAYVRETEWQAAQAVSLWVDASASMSYRGAGVEGSKQERATVLALALSILLLRGGERVGLLGQAGDEVMPRAGRRQIERIYQGLTPRMADANLPDYGQPDVTGAARYGRIVLLSDFFADLDGVERAMAQAAAVGATGVMVQVLDPSEEEFPFEGRTLFESMTGRMRHETMRAADLRAAYQERLAARKSALEDLARASGWQFHSHHTGQPAQGALLWLYHALERRGQIR